VAEGPVLTPTASVLAHSLPFFLPPSPSPLSLPPYPLPPFFSRSLPLLMFPSGRFFAPTLLAECTHSMDIMTEESFGPVLGVMPVNDEEEVCLEF
jgi:hypothetical protein